MGSRGRYISGVASVRGGGGATVKNKPPHRGRPLARDDRSGGPTGARESEGCIGALTSGNAVACGPGRAKAARVGVSLSWGNMTDALTEESMSTSLLRVVERARREPEGRFHSLAHLMDVPALERAFHRLRGDAAVGVDGGTRCGAQRHRALHRRRPGAVAPNRPRTLPPDPPRGARSCTVSRSVPSPPPAARLHRSCPEHPRQDRPSPTEVDAVRTRTILAPRPVTPDTLEADAFVLCRAELRYSAREALHRRRPGRARRGNQPHGFCERSASRRGPGVADRAGSTCRPRETNDR